MSNIPHLMNHEVALPSLPPEIWLEILEYIPRSTHYNLVGMNRVIFEHVMDFLYQEIRFVDDDRRMLKSFEQISTFPSLARRVKSVLIQPSFLPGLGEPRPLESHGNILKVAASALKRCSGVQEMTIILHHHEITTSFSRFLMSLWNSAAFAWKLRALVLKTIPHHMLHLLRPLVSNKKFITLEKITFDIESGWPLADSFSVRRASKPFFLAFSNSLASISLTSYFTDDFVDAVAASGLAFPRLRIFKLGGIFGEELELERWSTFLAIHANTLEVILISFWKPSHSLRFDLPYIEWINPPQDHPGPHAFKGRVFPCLRSLQVGVRGREGATERLHPDSCHTRVLPNPASFAPNLTSLIINDTYLSIRRISDVASDLSPCATLLRLEFMAFTLSAEIFDVLAGNLPHLNALSIRFVRLQSVDDRLRRDEQVQSFTSLMEARRYTKWKLQRLRLTRVESTCNNPHPQSRTMRIVAQSFPMDISLDCNYDCFCQKGLFGGEEEN